jgi:hypothetical protein
LARWAAAKILGEIRVEIDVRSDGDVRFYHVRIGALVNNAGFSRVRALPRRLELSSHFPSTIIRVARRLQRSEQRT